MPENGSEGAGGARRQKMPIAARWRLPLVAIDNGRRGGGDRPGMASYWPKNSRKMVVIVIGCSGVTGGNCSHDSSHGWSQNEELDNMNLSRWLDRPEVACWRWKMAQMRWRRWNTNVRKQLLVATTAAPVVVRGMDR